MLGSRIAYALMSSAAFAVMAFAAPQAMAQSTTTAKPSDANEVESLVVTARRREESQQEVPVAVSTFSEKSLEQHSIHTVMDFTSVPNFRVIQDTANSATATLMIRGQVSTNITVNFDPAVGVYVDEVYLGRATGNVVTSLLDVQSVEVLRGTQGTLFGRNNTGGALVIRTRKPNLDQYEGQIGVGYGNHNLRTFESVVNVPLVEGKLGLRIVANGAVRDGFLKSTTTGIDDFGDQDRKAIRLALRYAPTDDLTFDLGYDSAVTDETGQLQACMSALASTGCLPLGSLNSSASTVGDTNPLSRAAVDGYSLNTTWDPSSNIKVKAILAYRRLSAVDIQDSDGGPTTVGDFFLRKYQHQYTAELNASGAVLENTYSWLQHVDWVGGLFYFKELGLEQRQVPWFTTSATGSTFFVDATNKSTAAYGQLEAKFTNGLSAFAGARYTIDNREGRSARIQLGSCVIPAPGTPIPGVCRGRANAKFKYWSWQAGLRYAVNDNINTYVRAARGTRAGGIDNNTLLTFRPETITEYEAGVKADWFNRRLRTNLAVFKGDFKDAQRSSLQSFGNPPLMLSSTSNAASATLKGVEFEGTAILGSGFTLGASVGYLYSKYDTYLRRNANGTTSDFSGIQLGIPWTYSVSLDYAHRFDHGGDFSASLAYDWRDVYQHLEFRPLDLPPVGLLNGRMSYEIPLSGNTLKSVKLSVWGRNLTDERFTTTGFVFVANTHTLFRTMDTRAFGVELKADF